MLSVLYAGIFRFPVYNACADYPRSGLAVGHDGVVNIFLSVGAHVLYGGVCFECCTGGWHMYVLCISSYVWPGTLSSCGPRPCHGCSHGSHNQ